MTTIIVNPRKGDKIKAYDLPLKVTKDGKLELPETLRKQLLNEHFVRVIVLLPEPSDQRDDDGWARIPEQEFLQGYSGADSVYDNI